MREMKGKSLTKNWRYIWRKSTCKHTETYSKYFDGHRRLSQSEGFDWFTRCDVAGDLFDMLLPMLSIYQEYVRNHHYSLQVLTECKQSPPFAALLARLENKPACQGRSLETFLTYPMHQVIQTVLTAINYKVNKFMHSKCNKKLKILQRYVYERSIKQGQL